MAAFGLEIEAVVGDGDCAFRSLAKQTGRLSRENESFEEHLKSLNLLKTEDEDTLQLRQLFADKIAEGDDELLAFLPFENNDGGIEAKVNEFRCAGVYDKTLGDLIMKTCAEVLEVTIVVVTSNESVPWLLFIPAMEFGSWTKMETCILSTTESYIAGIAPTTENIQKLYNYVIKGVTSQEGIGLTKTKSLNQVRARLLHKRKREEALRGFLSAVTYTVE